jgi:allantoinase
MGRDLIGYANSVPPFEWPGNALIAVNIVINYETGAEACIEDGDDHTENWTEWSLDLGPGQRDLTTESLYEYGSRVGIWRVLGLLDAYNTPATIFAAGRALERNPHVMAAFLKRDYDFVGHGYTWESHSHMNEGSERAHIRRAKESVLSAGASSLNGWFTRPPQTPNTRRLLAQEGFRYDSDACNDDIPYFTDVDGRPFLVVPYTQDVNDGKFWRGEFFSASDFASYAIDTFDYLIKDVRRLGPRMMTVGLHPRIIGRPGRIGGLERLLKHIADHRQVVWLTQRDSIASFWIENFASSDAWNWNP